MAKLTHVISSLPPRGLTAFAMDAADTAGVLPRLSELGIQGISGRNIRDMLDAYAMDEDPTAPQLTASVMTPIQFLQNWLPGFVATVTKVRQIDELLGVVTAGAWEDEEVVQGVMEPLGSSQAYSDSGNVPLVSYNMSYERRTVVRREMGMRTGILDGARASRARMNDADIKRKAAGSVLEIDRNRIGFSGYNDGNNRTYGFLNDPNLPSAIQFALGAQSSRSWALKTFLEITTDILTALAKLRTQSGGRIDPKKTAITMALPLTQVDYLSTVTDFGISVSKWLSDNYSNIRIISMPELTEAVGGADVCYFYAENPEDDLSTDNGATWAQIVPARFKLLGVQPATKANEEDYSLATAGVILKRPWAVVRYLFA